jgi:glycosyltransferase involved in cell wall biosynthesis
VSVAFAQANGAFADRCRARGLRVVDLGLESGYDVRPWTLRRAAASLAKAEIVHAHAFNLPLGRVFRRAGNPLVFTHHGNFGQGRRIGFRGALKRRMERRFFTNECEFVAANSRWTARRLSEIFDIDLSSVAVVYNGIDPAMVTTPAARQSDALVVVFVGRLVRFKRVDRIIRAVARLESRRDIHVTIVGGGPLEHDLRALAHDLGVESQVRFLGWQSDIATVLSQADVLVLPSEGEPFGLAMIEASSQGLLTIAFADGGGVLETVPPDGYVVHSVDELADVLTNLRESDALSLDARRARSNWTREEFSIRKTAARYEELYRAARRT